ncbi:MAG: META domain-containing protein [Pseudohongiellaceae bacterium]
MAHPLRRFKAALLVLFSAGLLACASAPSEAPAPEMPATGNAAPVLTLTGTPWQLVEIVAMNDEAFRPLEVEIYTLNFLEDGALAVRADCNRGSGSYARQGSSLEIGDIALTRAMCRPQSLADRFLRELGYVRSFVIEAGNLYLATEADGAILEFAPAPRPVAELYQ